MKTLEGIAKQPGIAIAVAAIVDATNGINSVSTVLLQSGISALRSGSSPSDYAEAVIACDSLAVGALTKIPGINTVGIAAESDTDAPDLAIEVACVIGVADLLTSISEGDILIVDGYKGVVHIDPDPQTLAHYQQAEERRRLRQKVFITSEHIPARTQSGETVAVYARLSGSSRLEESLSAGADGLLVDLRGSREDAGAISKRVLREAAGKPVMFVAESGCAEILRAVMAYCTAGQVMLVAEDADLLASHIEAAMDTIVLEALQLDIDAPSVNAGRIAHAGACEPTDPSLVVIEAADCDIEGLPRMREETIVAIGGRLGSIEPLVSAGIRRVAVDPDRVAEAKYAIRSIGSEEAIQFFESSNPASPE